LILLIINQHKNHYQQLSEINLLTSPSEMGELVKVMAIANNNQMELKGFGDFDRTHLL
jgi:SAM-dependent MidA family methyltransferase